MDYVFIKIHNDKLLIVATVIQVRTKVEGVKHQKNHSSTRSKYSKSHLSSFGSFHRHRDSVCGWVFFFGDYANCHENVILAVLCVNTFVSMRAYTSQSDTSNEQNRDRIM